MERTLEVTLELLDEEHFTVTVLDNETGLSQTFDQNTPQIEEKIGVEVMSWLDMMDCEEE